MAEKVLITGCGRSGTVYIATCLNLVGIGVGHEQMGPRGAVSGAWCAPEPPYPHYHERGERPEFDVIAHQVREPLATIGSITTSLEQSWKFMARWIPISMDWPVLKRAVHAWYHWNQMALDQAAWGWRIEDLPWESVLTLFNHEYVPLPQVSKTTNHRDHVEVTWADVEKVSDGLEVKGMARAFGYSIGEGE